MATLLVLPELLLQPPLQPPCSLRCCCRPPDQLTLSPPPCTVFALQDPKTPAYKWTVRLQVRGSYVRRGGMPVSCTIAQLGVSVDGWQLAATWQFARAGLKVGFASGLPAGKSDQGRRSAASGSEARSERYTPALPNAAPYQPARHPSQALLPWLSPQSKSTSLVLKFSPIQQALFVAYAHHDAVSGASQRCTAWVLGCPRAGRSWCAAVARLLLRASVCMERAGQGNEGAESCGSDHT